MKFKAIPICCFSIFLLLPADALAQQNALFLLGNLQQRVEFTYRYNGRETDLDEGARSHSRRHNFWETYGLDIDYGVLHPDIWNGHLRLEGDVHQQFYSSSRGREEESSSDTGTELRYDIDGLLFQYRPVTINFLAQSETVAVARELSEDYESQVDALGVNLHAKNRRLPFRLEYSRTQTETDGLTADFERTSENVLLWAALEQGARGRTTFHFRRSQDRVDQENDPDDDRVGANEAALANNLRWLSGRNRRALVSQVSYREEEGHVGSGQPVDNRYFSWSEALDWQFGRALDGGLQYNRGSRDSFDSNRRYHSGRAFLRHRFVESLDTQISVEGRKDSFPEGEEESVFGSVSFSYRKRLPARSDLFLHLGHDYGVIDRDLDGSALPVFAEPHTATLLGQFILTNPNVLPETIEVRHADPLVRLTPFELGTDYLVDTVGQLTIISIPLGSQILDGTPLLVSYSFATSGDIEYEQATRYLNAVLSLRDNTHRLYGSVTQSDQNRISGDDELLTLRDTSTVTLGGESRWRAHTFVVEYMNYDTGFEEQQSFKGAWSYWRRFHRTMVTLGLADTYSTIEGKSSDGAQTPDRDQNAFNARVSVQRPVASRGILNLAGIYNNTRGDVLSRDDVMLRLDYRMRYGQFSLELQAKTDWQWVEDDSRREDYLQLRLVRYF